MRFLRKSVIALALGLSLSSASPGDTTFTVKRGSYPWHVWVSPPYKQNFTWPEFRKKVADLNQLVDSPKTFRHLKRGTVLKVPPPPGSGVSEDEIAKRLVEQKKALEADFEAAKRGWNDEKTRLLRALNQTAQVMYRNPTFWLIVVLALVLGLVAMYFLSRRNLVGGIQPEDDVEYRRIRRECEEINRQLLGHRAELNRIKRESEARDYFLRRFAVPFEVPEDFGYVMGKTQTAYFVKTEPIDGEPAVLVQGENIPVKVVHLKRHLYKMPDDILRLNGITKTVLVEDTEPTRAL